MFIGPYGHRDNLDGFWMTDIDDFFESCFDDFFDNSKLFNY